MGKCSKCNEFFAPDFIFPLKGEDLQCVFCMLDKNEITIGDGKDGKKPKTYKKKDAIEDYKIFLKMLKSKPSISKYLMKKNMEERKK